MRNASTCKPFKPRDFPGLRNSGGSRKVPHYSAKTQGKEVSRRRRTERNPRGGRRGHRPRRRYRVPQRDSHAYRVNGTGDIATGVQILRHALEEPLRQLAENAGHDGAVVVQIAAMILTTEALFTDMP